MKKSASLLMAVLVSLAVSPAFATPISFSFSFHDYQYGGDIVGIIEGLEDNVAFQPATSVIVTSNSLGYGLGEYVGNPMLNQWSVTNGVITSGVFGSYGFLNSAPDVVCCGLIFIPYLGQFIGGLVDSPNLPVPSERSVVTITAREDSTVPVPAPIALIGLGLLGIRISHRKKTLVA